MAANTYFGDKLRKLRIDSGLTQQKLAKSIRARPKSFSSLESGEREPSWREIKKLAAALDVPLAELIKHTLRAKVHKSKRGIKTAEASGQKSISEENNAIHWKTH